MELIDVLNGVEYEVINNSNISNIEITNITNDSRKVEKDNLFICVKGFKFDGHQYIDDAIEKGAKVIIIEDDVDYKDGITYIKVKNMRKAEAIIANNFFEHPSRAMKVIGVTGTKGKTTTTYMMKSIFEKAGYKVGLIGTIANYIGNEKIETSRTTPDSIELQSIFARMKKEKVDITIMEVSSHALDLHRVDGIDYDIAVFTNLSQDHLDYHKNFENYYQAKKLLFNMCKTAVINIDDEYGKRLHSEINCEKISLAINNSADYRAEDIEINSQDVTYRLNMPDKGICDVDLKIPGEFSVYNSMYAFAVASKMGVPVKTIKEGLKDTKVPGRAQIVESDKDFAVMVDYAHSPASLENILTAVKNYCKGRIICIFGCGGDRDTAKRAIMGKISGELADFTIITSDNPRSEDPKEILKQIEKGIIETRGKYTMVEDRKEAIQYGINIAKKDDMVLIAGKGHENYQEFKNKTIHFDDVEVAKEILKKI